MDFDFFMGVVTTFIMAVIFSIGVAVGIENVKSDCRDYSKYTERSFDMTCNVVKE